jgi:hypothetical protein
MAKQKASSAQSARAGKSLTTIGEKSVLSAVLSTAQTLPEWLRFIVVFAVLLVVVVLSGKAVQPSLAPLLYILFLIGSLGYVLVETRRPRTSRAELSEKEWLDQIVSRLTDCKTAYIYLRYFRDPDFANDQRLRAKQGQLHALMMEFSQMLLNNQSGFLLVGFRKNSWTDDPKGWLVREMRRIKPDITENAAKTIVEAHVLVIHEEPQPNSSTVYLVNDRYLFFNRVSGELGAEAKQYHMHDYSNSLIPLLIRRGLAEIFENSHSTSRQS